MSTRVVGGVAIDYIARTGKFTAGSQKVREELAQIKAQSQLVSTEMKVLGLAIAAAGYGLYRLVSAQSEYLRRLIQTSERLNLTAEAMAAFNFAAKRAGVSTDQVSTALQTMTRNIGEAVSGNAEMSKAFRRLNLDATQLAQLAPQEQYALIAERISRLATNAQKASAAMDIFGRGGAGMLNMIKAGRAGFDEASAKVREYGSALSQVEADQISKFNDRTEELEELWNGIKTRITVEVATGLNYAIDATQRWIKAVREAPEGPGWMAQMLGVGEGAGAQIELLYPQQSNAARARAAEAARMPGITGIAGLEGETLAGLQGTAAAENADWLFMWHKQMVQAREEIPHETAAIQQELVKALGDIGLSGMEIAAQQAQQQTALIQRAYDMGAISFEQMQRRMTQVTRQETARRAQMYISDVQFIVGGLQEIAGNAEMSAKQQFRVTKALKIAETICNTAAAVMRYHSEGRTAMAWTAGIIGAAQVAAIAATEFEGGGSVAPATGGAEAVPALSEGSNLARQPQNLTLILEGGNRRYTREEIVDMLNGINELLGDGVHLNVSGG
jgi:hypothetical protein